MLAFTWIEPSATGLSYDHQAFPIFYLMSLAFNGAIHTHRRGWNPAVTGNWALICDHQAFPVFYLCHLYWMVQGEETENLAVASDRALALSLSLSLVCHYFHHQHSCHRVATAKHLSIVCLIPSNISLSRDDTKGFSLMLRLARMFRLNKASLL